MKRNTKATTHNTNTRKRWQQRALLEKQGHENATKAIKYVNSKIPLQTIIMHVVY